MSQTGALSRSAGTQMDDKQPRDDSSPIVVAMQWSSRITTISLELIVPVLIGYWLDRLWGSLPLLIIVGVIIGFATATLSLMRLVKRPRADYPRD